jgi:hypothetical protein
MGRVVARRETVVALPEEIDLLNATRVAERLTSAVRRHPAVIIDMTATTFCDCCQRERVPSCTLTSVPPAAAPRCAWW